LSLLLQQTNELPVLKMKNVGRIADKSIMAPPAGLEPATL
jgi:hypothetical protein